MWLKVLCCQCGEKRYDSVALWKIYEGLVSSGYSVQILSNLEGPRALTVPLAEEIRMMDRPKECDVHGGNDYGSNTIAKLASLVPKRAWGNTFLALE
ncbi:hypothetical protein NPIL_587981, partial [Nephila pilipes]